MNKKETGSFYTPKNLIKFMVSYIGNRVAPSSILEPSAGDGRFIKYIKLLNSDITLVEFDAEKATQLSEKYNEKYKVICSDFISYSLQEDVKFDLIIGNPPYIAKKAVPQDQYEQSLKIASHFKLDKAVIQNLWVSFVLSSIKMLENNGVIFFVLPFEFLQVQYAEKLRNFLETKFNIIEIITFEEQIFEDIEQDICLVYLANEPNRTSYIQYKTLISAEDTTETFSSIIKRNKPLKKWSNCILNDEETDSFMKLASSYPKVSEFGEISPGIVTGANSFFILPHEKIINLEISDKNVLPIITKSSNISSVLLYNSSDFDLMISKNTPTHLINLNGLEEKQFCKALKDYIIVGEERKINNGFKCRHRKRWYDVPIVKNGQACFFKRYHNVPKIIVNKAGVHTTDIAYNIRFKKEYDAESFVFCFYNSLTLALCEYNGRFYGGGVGELVPKEFKELHVPYKEISKENIHKLDMMFRSATTIDKIVDFVDEIILDTLRSEDKYLLQKIRKKYIARRMKIYQRRPYNNE